MEIRNYQKISVYVNQACSFLLQNNFKRLDVSLPVNTPQAVENLHFKMDLYFHSSKPHFLSGMS